MATIPTSTTLPWWLSLPGLVFPLALAEVALQWRAGAALPARAG